MNENKNAKTPADDDQPVAWRSTSPDGKLSNKFVGTSVEVNWTPIYTEPPKRELTCVCGAVWEGETMVHSPREREWVGLTDEEHDGIKHNYHDMTWTLEMFGRAIEQALKEKNHGTGRVYADETKIPEDVPCKTHPDAPHGFDRNMSHTLDRYVCECEHWEPSESWEPSK